MVDGRLELLGHAEKIVGPSVGFRRQNAAFSLDFKVFLVNNGVFFMKPSKENFSMTKVGPW